MQVKGKQDIRKNIEVKAGKGRDPFWNKLIHYIHKNKKKYNRKKYKDEPDI